MTVDELINRLKEEYRISPSCRPIPLKTMKQWIDDTGLTRDQLFDAVALRLASGFASRELHFSFCSDLISSFQISALEDWPPPFFWDVYIAFDAGEFYHDERRDVDPSERHARPMIEEILNDWEISKIMPRPEPTA